MGTEIQHRNRPFMHPLILTPIILIPFYSSHILINVAHIPSLTYTLGAMYSGQLTFQSACFEMWKETGAPAINSYCHGQDNQTPHRSGSSLISGPVRATALLLCLWLNVNELFT